MALTLLKVATTRLPDDATDTAAVFIVVMAEPAGDTISIELIQSEKLADVGNAPALNIDLILVRVITGMELVHQIVIHYLHARQEYTQFQHF